MYPAAIGHALMARDIGTHLNDTVLLLCAYINLGSIYNRIGQPDSAMVWNRLAQKHISPTFRRITICTSTTYSRKPTWP